MSNQFRHFVANLKLSFFCKGWVLFCLYVPPFLHLVIPWLTRISVLALGNSVAVNLGFRHLFELLSSTPLDMVPEVGLLGTWTFCIEFCEAASSFVRPFCARPAPAALPPAACGRSTSLATFVFCLLIITTFTVARC